MAKEKFRRPEKPKDLEAVREDRSRQHRRANRRRQASRAFRQSADGRAKARKALDRHLGETLAAYLEDDGEKRVLCGNIPNNFI